MIAYGGSNVAMMADVIREQRKLIRKVYGSETAVPQVFIPYKGMADIYNDGLASHIPDDVMLMWAEDNYGNLRQTPTEVERKRNGGCGIYYHSSYWSRFSPKSYLWLNSTQIFYMSHQLHRAYDCGVGKYWILNVGDIKPGEIVTELFLKTAWNVKKYGYAYIEEYLIEHAKRDFYTNGETAEKNAELATDFYHLCGIKKAEFFGHVNGADVNNPYFSEEMIYPFSISSENDEGGRLVEKCNAMVAAAGDIYDSLDREGRDTFYQQLYYHIISYRDVAEEYVYLWKNNLSAKQGRYNSAKAYMSTSRAARDRIPAEQERFLNRCLVPMKARIIFLLKLKKVCSVIMAHAPDDIFQHLFLIGIFAVINNASKKVTEYSTKIFMPPRSRAKSLDGESGFMQSKPVSGPSSANIFKFLYFSTKAASLHKKCRFCVFTFYEKKCIIKIKERMLKIKSLYYFGDSDYDGNVGCSGFCQ